MPGGEYLAVEYGDVRERHEDFADARINEFSDWFNETPALLAHIRALQTDRDPDIRARLVDTEAACTFTGRDNQTIYRWARTGLLTRHWIRRGESPKRGWDILELEAAVKKFAQRS